MALDCSQKFFRLISSNQIDRISPIFVVIARPRYVICPGLSSFLSYERPQIPTPELICIGIDNIKNEMVASIICKHVT